MKYRKLKYPPKAYWEVTPECNHNCVHCYNYWRKDDEIKNDIVSATQRVSFEDITNKIIEQKPTSICITGGEPLMVWKHIKPCIEKFLANNITVSINSNGAMITDEIADFAKAHKIPFFISFPCVDEQICDEIIGCKGGFRRTNRGLSILKEKGVRFGCNMVVSTRNIDYIFKTAQFVKEEYGCEGINITRVGKPINAADEFNGYLLSKEQIRFVIDEKMRIVNELHMSVQASMPYAACVFKSQEEYSNCGERIGCGAGKTSYIVTSDGGVKACTRDTKIYGNLLTEPFEEIWARMEEWRDESLVPDECKGCKAYKKGVCTTGCRTDQLSFTGRRDQMDFSANPANKNPEYHRTLKIEFDISDDDLFYVSDNLVAVKETVGYRVHVVGSKHSLMITDDAYEFISTHDHFDLQVFSKSENYGEQGKAIIQQLLYCGIIKKRG